jgi:uncharacterized membrane protein YdjX (TVP38/TMEM64 family)
MKKYWKRIVLAAIILCLVALIWITGAGQYLTFENFRSYKGHLTRYVEVNYFLSVLVYIGLYIMVAALSIPGATALTFAGGFLFGIIGVAYVNIGATAGGTLLFLTARYLLGNWIQERYANRLAAFNREIDEHGYNYLLTLRFIPLFPFFLVNIFAGLTRVPLSTYIWTTAAGIIPGSFVYVFAGTQLGSIDSPSDILSWKIVLAFIFLGIFALVPVLIKKVKSRKDRKDL